MDFQEKFNNYATLIVRHGMNVQAGQLVNISAEVCHRELAYLVAQKSYEAGAHFVNLDFIEPRLARIRIIHSAIEDLKYFPPHVGVKCKELVEKKAASLSLVGSEYPDLLVDLDPVKINTGRLARYQALKYFYDEGIGKSQIHWTVAAASTPKWAHKVFPDSSPHEGQNLLWEEIFKICRVDRPDFLEEWQRHNTVLHNRAKKLTDMKLKTIHFEGPGTDLFVGFSEKSLFKGGGETGPQGEMFEPNLPTEECFTAPDWRKTEGKVRTTRPFFINGKLIKGLTLEFFRGEIKHFNADEGENTFKEYINSDPGGKRLGEVALVGIDSPVYQSGHVFEEILLDENAACHIAIGSAYTFCIKKGNTMSKEELEAIGFNESSVHTDMMISSEEVTVTGQTFEGEKCRIIKQGDWVEI